MSHYEPLGGPPWMHIANSNSNFNFNPGGNIINNNPVNNNVNNYIVAPETTSNAIATIEKALGQHHLPGAAFEAQPANAGCMPGTRVHFLEQVLTLLATRTRPHIAWIVGMAGTGKTSIATTLCRILWAKDTVLLGGSFFCSRSTGTIERTEVQRIVPTLATILGRHFPAYALALAKQLCELPDVAHWSPQKQVEILLTLPLAENPWCDGQIVFVVDALDECSDQGKLVELIDALADFKSELPVKFLLTSRPEMYIRRTPISDPDFSSVLRLHTVEHTQVTPDLRLYIEQTLLRVSRSTTWYTQFDVEALVQRSDGLFIFASTVLKYILDRNNDDGRKDRLRKVTSTVSHTPASISSLDQIYELVLTEASRPEKVDTDELEDTRRILACILTARASLSIQVLADLTDISPATLRGALERLPSLVHVPDVDADSGIRTLHASFGDYMFDRAENLIRITPGFGHGHLAHGCLRRLEWDDLCFNISVSRSSFEPNPDDVPGWISSSLCYACLHWAHHLDAASNGSTFDKDVDRVFQRKLLFWLEVLSVMKELSVASGLLRMAASVVQLPAVVMFLRDANSFVASSYDAIARSAPHIYLSALPFAAKDSLVWRYFGSRCMGVVSVETFGIGRHSQSLVTTLTGHTAPATSLAYSQNGRYLASGSGPEPHSLIVCNIAVRAWDTRTGEQVMVPMRIDHARILAITFVLNDTAIAVCTSKGLARVRDISTGRDLRSWQCNKSTSEIDCAAFSLDGTLATAGPWWEGVLIWSIDTGKQIFALQGPRSAITRVLFSSKGLLAAMSSGPLTVWFWDGRTGLPIGNPLVVQKSREHVLFPSLAVSPSGNVLAVGLSTNKIEIYDLNRRTRASVLIDSSHIPYPLEFSLDELNLAVVCNDTIHFWDPRTKEETDISLRGHTGRINFVSYSPDGLYVASASSDHTIRIWDVGSKTAVTQPLPQPSPMTCLALSNNSMIISGSDDGSVQVWDAQNGQRKQQMLMGIESRVSCVAISPNGQLIASASFPRPSDSSNSYLPEFSVIRLWNAQTGEPVDGILEGFSGVVRDMAFLPDMVRLVSASQLASSATKTCAFVHIWSLATRLPSTIGTFEKDSVGSSQSSRVLMSMSPDGQSIAVAVSQAGRVQIWQTHSGQPLGAPFQNQYKVYFVAFSCDGSNIVIGSRSGAFEVTNIHSRQIVSIHADEIATRGYPSIVQPKINWLARSPNERFMAREASSWSLLGTKMRLWDAEMPGMITTVRLNEVGAGAVFSTDSQSLVIGGRDRIMVWQVEAVLNLASRPQCDPLAQILREGLNQDGWVVGSSGDLLLWIPAAYREYLQLPPCTLMTSKHRVALSGDADGLRYGTDWTSCWR